MKKLFLIISIIVLSIMLVSCEDKSQNDENNSEDNSEEITFSPDDFAVFSSKGIGKLIAYLYMPEEDLPYDDEDVGDMISSFNIGFQELDGKKKINYIYFNGNPFPVQTAKKIYTTGIDFFDEELCSNEEDVIESYGLNADEEEIYKALSENSDSKFISIFFKIDNEGNVERVKYPKGTDISDFNSLDANVYIYFEIKDGKVAGIIMGRK